MKEIKIPPGTKHGQKLRLKDQGMIVTQADKHKLSTKIKDTEVKEKGDHVVIFQIEIPDKVSKEQEDALLRFGELGKTV